MDNRLNMTMPGKETRCAAIRGARVLSSAYFPPVQYFTKLLGEGRCFIEQHENYVKQTYRNRCVIDSPNGALALTVPVEKPSGAKCLMKDVRISEHGGWRHVHWQAFTSSYFNTPFFEYYQDDFRPFFEKKYDFLIDLNEELTLKCCELIDIQPDIVRTQEYVRQGSGEYLSLAESVSPGIENHCIEDFRMSISPKVSLQDDPSFSPVPYYQVFAAKHGFLPNLSIADLLFNMGPESLIVLRNCVCGEMPLK